MEDGQIVEQGNHNDLLDLEGAYFSLYQSQFSGSSVEFEQEPTPLP
jgi:ATP-binding cassette subfamily B multidrug efflux pump